MLFINILLELHINYFNKNKFLAESNTWQLILAKYIRRIKVY